MNDGAREWAACAPLAHATQRRFITPHEPALRHIRLAETPNLPSRPETTNGRLSDYRPRAVPNNRPFRVGRTKSGREAARATRAGEEAGQRAQGTAGDAAGIG
ncbi:hypothetical protein KAREA_11070 [Prescottella equi]|nr:hypothetical protein KAREA_11070 [Prescottella equi]